MLVVDGVPFAFLATGEAGRRTGFERRADHAEISRGLPCHRAAGGVAGVGAVEVQPNAADQLSQIVLAQARIGACGTACSAVEALSDTAQECVAIQISRRWMRFEDLFEGHGSFLHRSGGIAADLRALASLAPVQAVAPSSVPMRCLRRSVLETEGGLNSKAIAKRFLGRHCELRPSPSPRRACLANSAADRPRRLRQRSSRASPSRITTRGSRSRRSPVGVERDERRATPTGFRPARRRLRAGREPRRPPGGCL